MSLRKIIRAFEAWRSSGEPMVLASVYDTVGSTYTKPGHRIVIAANGDFQGLVSGGCLEGDVAEHARGVLETRVAAALTYDMRDGADELFGLGIGCNGLIRIFLQPLVAADGYVPFSRIAELAFARTRSAVATVVESSDSTIEPGTTLVLHGGAIEQLCGRHVDTARFDAGLRRAEAGAAYYAQEESRVGVLYAPIKRVPRLLVLGAGLDAVPVLRIADELGWIVTVCDHRPAYLERAGFEAAEHCRLVDPRSLGDFLDTDAFDAALVMSHHLATDTAYLGQLADANLAYLGVLGPPGRRERILESLGGAGERLRGRLRGPVGIDIGADSPESIALSVVAELHAVYAREQNRD